MFRNLLSSIEGRFARRRTQAAYARAVQRERDLMEAEALNRMCGVEERQVRPASSVEQPERAKIRTGTAPAISA